MAAPSVRPHRPRRARHRRRVRPRLRDRRGTGTRRRARRAERPPCARSSTLRARALSAEGVRAHAAPFDVTDAAAVGERRGPDRPRRSAPSTSSSTTRRSTSARRCTAFTPEEWRALHGGQSRRPVPGHSRGARRGCKRAGAARSSTSARLPPTSAVPNIVPYAASKGALRMLTRALAVEVAPHNVQVNGIAPGFFRTEMNARAHRGSPNSRRGSRAARRRAAGASRRRLPAQRCFSPPPRPTTSPDTSFTSTGDFGGVLTRINWRPTKRRSRNLSRGGCRGRALHQPDAVRLRGPPKCGIIGCFKAGTAAATRAFPLRTSGPVRNRSGARLKLNAIRHVRRPDRLPFRPRRAFPATTPAILALADGTVFRGHAIGATGYATGEVVFNTAMTGLPGDPDRPVVRRPDRHADLSAHRQHRRQRARTSSRGGCSPPGSSSATCRGRPRTSASTGDLGAYLARRQHRRHRRHRHARA